MSLYFKFILIYLILNNKWVIVESSGSEADLESGTEGEQAPQSTATQLKPEVYSIVIKLFKADANDSNKTVELATTEYRTEKLVDEHLYVFNSGINCNLLKIDDKDVWKYDSSKHNGKYPKGMRVNKRFKFVLVEFDGTVKVLIKGTDGNWTPFELDIKLFKDDSNNNKVEIKETDFYEDQYLGNLTYAFKKDVTCTQVKFGDKDVWKKGDEQVDEPKSVTYNFMDRIVVRNAKKSVVYRKDDSGKWVHYYTIERQEQDSSYKSSGDSSASQSGSPGSGLSSEKPGDRVSSGTPGSAEASGEAEDPSTVAPEATDANEVSKDAGLRGTSGSADTKEEADETASLASGGADTSEEKEKDPDQEKEACEAEDSQGGGSPPPADGGTEPETKTGVDLNITSETQSTDNYDYKKVGEYVTYSAKDNHAFQLVMDGEIEVWKASGNNYSSKIEVDLMSDGSKAVTVFPLDETKVFLKGSNDTSFTEIDVSKINAKTVNIGFEHESYFYKNELIDNIRTFTAKKGFMFNGANDYVDNDKIEVWKAANEKEHANKIVNEGNKVTIHLADGTTKEFSKGPDGRWPGTVKGVVLNIKAKAGCSEYYYSKANKTVTFTAKGNKGFMIVDSKKDGSCSCGSNDVTIWETNEPKEYATKVVLEGKGKKQKEVTIHMPNNTKKVFTRAAKDKPWTGVSQQNNQDNGQPCGSTPASGSNGTTGGRRMSSDPDGTPLASSGGDGTSSGSGTGQSTDGSGANHTSSGESTESGDGREDAKSGGWTSGSVQDGSASLPTTDGDSGTLTGVEESTDKGEGEDGSTQSSSGAPTSGGTGLTSVSDKSANGSPEDGGSSATPLHSSGGDGTSGGADSDGGGTDTSSGAGTGTNEDGKGKGAGEPTETGGEGEDGNSQPSGGDGGSKTREDDTGTSGGDGSSATLPTAGGASPDGGTEPETKTGVELSLKKTSGTNEFSYNKVGSTVTYTAKDGFGFSSVKTKTGGSSCGSSCGGSDVTIWDAKDANEYANKVVLYGKGKKEKIVTIYLLNGTKKSYKKDGKNKPWNEYTGPLPSTGNSATSKELNPDEYPKEIKLFKADADDATKDKELSTSEYKVKKDGDDHIYEFNDGVNCNLLKIDDKEVWKHDSSKHSGKYPKSLTYNNKDFKIILNFTDLRIVCEKDGDSYKATEYKPKTAVQLDIKQSSGTNEFDHKKDGNVVTFTAKDNYGFNVVRCKNMDYHRWVDIWKTDNENEYSKKVVLEGDNKLTIHIGDSDSASTKVFNKGGYCEWKEDTQASTQKSSTGGSGGGGTD
ncbi:hypothetical protein MACK_002228 [Theileria orientalis]|uniref:SfiI-subtelomeric related protein family member n=1 Tax=Theileria orientalis TaxID=68886 RepID=A0A976QSZ3_THEOR|nr:hypothetical protein MACK_002228 [Theileria orientalis]